MSASFQSRLATAPFSVGFGGVIFFIRIHCCKVCRLMPTFFAASAVVYGPGIADRIHLQIDKCQVFFVRCDVKEKAPASTGAIGHFKFGDSYLRPGSLTEKLRSGSR